jgi:K+-sensing histidine kinase KdpD
MCRKTLDSAFLRRATTFCFITLCIAGLHLLLFQLFTFAFGQPTPGAVFSSTLSAAALVVFIFTRLRKQIQDYVDKRLFPEFVNRDQKMHELARAIATQSSADDLAQTLITGINQIFQPQKIVLCLRSHEGPKYIQFSLAGESVKSHELPSANPLVDYFQHNSQPFVVVSDLAGETLDTRDH